MSKHAVDFYSSAGRSLDDRDSWLIKIKEETDGPFDFSSHEREGGGRYGGGGRGGGGGEVDER